MNDLKGYHHWDFARFWSKLHDIFDKVPFLKHGIALGTPKGKLYPVIS